MCWTPAEFERVDVDERLGPGNTREAGLRSDQKELVAAEHPHAIFVQRYLGRPGRGEPRETIISSALLAL